MSQAFNLTAQINLQAPTNLKTVVAQIRRELGTVSADVKINISGASARNIDNITRRLDAMNAALIQARTNTSSLDTALRSLTTSFSSLQSSSTKTTSGLSNTITTVKQTAKNLQVATTEMEEFGKQSALAIRRFAAFSVVTTGVFALTNAITSGFKAFVEFDKELVKLQQVTGKGVVGLRGLEKEITVLATSLGVSSKSLIEVASTLAQAGLTAEDTRIALAALAKTELAPSFDSLADTTEGAIAALRQFGLQAKDLEKALGSINAVAAAFAVESKDIIAAIQRTGGVFAAASRGVSEGTDALNEFVAVFTSVRATTRESAETIATGLRTIFTRLQRTKTIDQLKEFGVELTDLEGKFVGPFEAVKRLSQALNQLDPRDLRFSSIVEELGGFRQIGKVIPLIQQFATAQEALKVAQKGQGSLTEAQITAQKSLANQLAKVREQFLALIRDVGKSQTFQGLFKVVTGLASGLISLAGAFKPILPILAIMGAVKGVSAITQFASGFAGGIKKGGGVGSVGSNVGETLSGAKDKEKSDTQQKANTMIAENTSAIKTLTTAMNSLIANIAENTRALASSNSQTLNGGGVVKKFARGGLVPGSGNGDTVPAMLEPGEFVIRKKAVETIGAGNLQRVNKFAVGGMAVQDVDYKNTRDGDSLIVDYTPKAQAFSTSTRLVGYDAYEINKGTKAERAKGEQAKQITEDWAANQSKKALLQKFEAASGKKDKYGRPMFDAPRLGQRLVAAGVAVPYSGDGEKATGSGGFGEMLPGEYSMFYDEKNLGGLIKKLASGGGVAEEDTVLRQIEKLGGIKGVKSALGLSGGDRTADSLLRASNIRSGRNLPQAKELVQRALEKLQADGVIRAQEIEKATKVGVVGLQPFDKVDEEGPLQLGAKNAMLYIRGLSSKFSDAVSKMRDSVSSVVRNFAGNLQDTSIFGDNKPLRLDFDETLVSGADIFNSAGEIDIAGYSNLDRVKEGLEKGALTQLGEKVKELVQIDPKFIDRISILTARPQSNAKLLSQKLNQLGLPISADKIVGTSGSGTAKANQLKENEKLIDDNISNILAAKKQGKDAYQYGEIRDLSDIEKSATGFANIEGAVLEATLASLGAKPGSIQNRAIDYPDGLGRAAQLFPGIDPSWPTEVKRTLDGGSIGRAKEEFASFFGEPSKFKLGGQVYDLQQSKKFALGGLAEDTESMQALMSGLYGNRSTKNKPSKEYGKITISEEDGMISAGYMKNETRSGYASAYKMRPYLWYVGLSKATGGYGPKLYDILMEAVTEKGAMLTSDRSSVSGDAKGVWDYYFNNRSDVQKTPLKPSDWTVNSSLIDPKLYGKEETWPPKNDPAWVLQTGYSKTPKLINDENVIRGAKKFAAGGSVEDTVPALLTPGEFVINKKAAQKIGYSELSKMNKADKIQGYNKGGIVGGIQRFFRGGVAEKDAVRAQGSALTDIKQAEKTFAMIMGQLSKSMRDSIIKNFKGIESVGAGGKTSLGTGFSENTRGQAVFGTQKGAQVSAMGLQIGGKKVSATTDTVAHESGHLADYALGGNKAFASDTAGTFQFELVEKVKKTMEEAFKKAGENADTIEKYLANNKELFAEFFAKASPEVRAIITSTTEAKLGMQKLADHLGDTGYTFAGLEASDIDSSRPKTSSTPAKSSGGAQNIISSMASKITSFFKPNTSTPSSPAASAPPINPWPIDLMPLTTAAKTAAEAQAKAAEQAEYFAAKAKESGQSLNGFAKTLATKVVSKANSLIAELPGKKEDVRMSAIGLRGKVNSDEEVNNAISTFSSKLQAIDLGAGPDKIKAAAEAIAEGIKVGDSFDKIIASSTELKEILDKQYDSAQATEKAFASLSEETGIAADQLKKLIGQDNLRRQEFIQSEQGQRFGKLASIAPDAVQRFANTGAGAALGKAADFASGKGLIASVSKKFGDDIGKSLDTWLGRFGGPMGVLGAGLAILGDQLPKVIESLGMGSSTSAAAVAGGIKGAGQGLASGAVLGAQVAGPIGALIGGITGAVVSGISGAFEAYNDKKLENNLRSLDKASSDLEIAFKKLDSSATDANLAETQSKFNATVTAISDVAKQANLGASGLARGITETLRGLDPTGLVSSLTGQNQESEARQATINAVTKAVGDADKIGSVKLNKVSTSSITDFLDSTKDLDDASKQLAMARANQGYQTLKDSGMSEESIFLSKYAESQKQANKTSDEISKELGDPKKRKEAIEQGKRLLAVDGEIALKQAIMTRTATELAVATEQLIDVYRRAQAGLDKYSQQLAQFETDALSRVNDLTGNASIQAPIRTNENILGNISAYSKDEVAKAAEATSRLAGGGDTGQKLKNDIMTAKILKDTLPTALRNATAGPTGIDDVIGTLKDAFKNGEIELSPAVETQLREGIEAKTAGRQDGQGIGLSELADDSSMLDNLLKGPEAALKFGENLQARYNDTIDQSINLMNKYNDVLNQAEEYQRKATTVRLDAELELAKALGKSPTLKQLNSPFDTEIKSLTDGLVPGGTTDPRAISAQMDAAVLSAKDIQDKINNTDPSNFATPKEYLDSIRKDTQALAKQKKAIDNGNKALEKLANNSAGAANALSQIQSRQQTSQNSVNIAQKLLTSDETELADFTRQMQAYTKTIGGGASRQELGSLQFRRDAFGGLENIKSVLPENIAKQMQATLTRQMLSANPEGNRILQQQVGIDEQGKSITLDQALSNVEGGKLDPVQQKQIEAYNAAVQVQADAANALGDKALQAADILVSSIDQLMGNVNKGVEGLASQLQNVLPDAQAAAQGEPKPEVEAPKPVEALKTEGAGAGTITIPGFDDLNEASKVNTDALIASAAAAGLLMAAVYALKKAFEMFNSGGGIKDKLVDMFSGGSRRKRRRRRSKSKRGSSTRTKSSSDKGKSGSKTKRSRKPKTSSGKPTVKPKVSARGSRGKRRGGGILGTLLGMFGSEVVAGSLPENMQDAAYGAMDAADVALNVKDAAQAVKTAKSGAGVVRGGITAAKAGAGAVGAAAPPLIAANSAISIIDNAVQAAYDPAAYDANMRAKTEAGAQRATERETYGQLAGDSLGGAVQGFVDPAGKIVEGVYTGAGAVSDFAGAVSSGMSADRQERELQRKNKFGLTHTQYAQASDEASARLALQEAQKSNDAEGMLRAQQSIDSLQKNKIDSGARIDNWFTKDKDTANYSKAVEDFMAQKTASTKPQVEPAVTEQAKSATEASTAIQTMSKAAIGFATIVGSGLLTGTLGKTTEGSETPAASGIVDTVMGFVKSGAGSGATSSLGQLLSSIGLGDSLNKNDSSKPIYMDVLQKIADNITGSKSPSSDATTESPLTILKKLISSGVNPNTTIGLGSNGENISLNQTLSSPGFVSAAQSAAQSHPAPDAKIERKDGKLHVGNKPYEYSSPTSADPSSLTTMATGPQTSTQTSVQAVEAALPQFSKKQQGRLTSLSARGKARASDDGFRIGRTSEQEDEYQELRKLKLDSNPALKDKMRLAELKRKGKGRASEEGFRIGRTGEEEQEYNTLVANKPKTPYEQMQLSKREAYLSRLNPETRAIMEKKLGISSQDSQNPMTAPPVSTGPVPTSLSTQQVVNDRTSGTPGDRMTTDQTGSGYNITIDESSRQFLEAFSVTLNSFGSYIDKLSAIQLPDSITMKGEHVVDVRISGAAAFEGLKKDFMNMMQVEISNKMAMIWKQTGGKVGEAPTNTVDSNAGSIGQGRV
jgi:hypothetical protein